MRYIWLIILTCFLVFAHSAGPSGRSASEGPAPLDELPPLPPTEPSARPPPTRTQSLPTTLHPDEGWGLRLHQRIRIQDMLRGRDTERAVARYNDAPDAVRQHVAVQLRALIAAFGRGHRHRPPPPAVFAAVHGFEDRLRHDLAHLKAEYQRVKAEEAAAGRALNDARAPRNLRSVTPEERQQRRRGSTRLYTQRRGALKALWGHARDTVAPLQARLTAARGQIARMGDALERAPAPRQLRAWDRVMVRLAEARVQRLQDLCAVIASMAESTTGNYLERTNQLQEALDRRADDRPWLRTRDEYDEATTVGIRAAGWEQWGKSQLPVPAPEEWGDRRPVFEKPGMLKSIPYQDVFVRVINQHHQYLLWDYRAPRDE